MQIDIHTFNDNTHYEIRHNVFILITKVVGLELVITFIHILMNLLMPTHSFHDMALGNFSGQVRELIIFHAITTVVIIYFVLQWVTTYYIITNKEIVHTTGIISRKRSSYDLPGIQEIDSVQGFCGRILAYGDIVLENPLISSKIYLKNIPTPDYYAKLIKIIRDKNIQDKGFERMIPIKKIIS